MAEAVAGPYPLEAEKYEELEMKKLVAVCAALQRYTGEAPFYLSCRVAQRLCGFGSYHTAARRLTQLVDDKILTVVLEAEGGRTKRRATRYRWLGQLTLPDDQKEGDHGAVRLEQAEE